MSETASDRDYVRRAYMAFRAGARLRTDEVRRLLATKGVILTNNRANELGRDSDRGLPITSAELWMLISAWADEQRKTD